MRVAWSNFSNANSLLLLLCLNCCRTNGELLLLCSQVRPFKSMMNFHNLTIKDVGVYFAVVVGPVAGRFAAEHGDTVSRRDISNICKKKPNTSFPVAMAILRACGRRFLQLPRSLLLLLSSSAPTRSSHKASFQRARLRWCPSLRSLSDPHPCRHRIYHHPPV